jgi:hypothetical protein
MTILSYIIFDKIVKIASLFIRGTRIVFFKTKVTFETFDFLLFLKIIQLSVFFINKHNKIYKSNLLIFIL